MTVVGFSLNRLSVLAPDDVEQSAFTGDGAKPGQLRDHPLVGSSAIGLVEEDRRVLAVGAENGRRAVQVFDAVVVEPPEDLVERVPGLVRVVVLVFDPDLGLAGIVDARRAG